MLSLVANSVVPVLWPVLWVGWLWRLAVWVLGKLIADSAARARVVCVVDPSRIAQKLIALVYSDSDYPSDSLPISTTGDAALRMRCQAAILTAACS